MGGSDETAVRTLFDIGKYKFDSNRQLLIYKNEETKLTARESQLLRLLCLNINQTLDREKALSEIWEETTYFTGRSMDVFISRLRKLLKHDQDIEILGIHGKGFRLVVENSNDS